MPPFDVPRSIVNIPMAKKILPLLLIVLCLGVVGRVVFLGWIGSPSVGQTQRFTLDAGSGLKTTASKLEAEGLIAGSRWYRLYALLDRDARMPKAGTYTIQPGQRFSDIAALLVIGPESDEIRVQVIEGWSILNIRTMLKEVHGVSEEDVTQMVGREGDAAPFDSALRESFAFLRTLPAKRSLEGYLFPETYRVWGSQLPTSLITKQLQEFQRRFSTETVTAASAPLKTLDDVVILASIVEKEVSKPDERKMVAGIFLRRLREGMPLQSDATVNYITQSGRARSTAADLQIENAYNTYRNRGLPPGPISNPSEASLRAVLEPTPSPYRYFLTDEQGKIYYGRTLEEHVANRRKAGY